MEMDSDKTEKDKQDSTQEVLYKLPAKSEYIPIAINTMRTDAILDIEFYLKIGDKYTKYSEDKLHINYITRVRLQENHHTHLFIKSDSLHSFNLYLEKNLKSVLHDKKIKEEEKAAIFYDTTTHLVREWLVNPRSKENASQSRKVVAMATEFILSSSSVPLHLMQISSVDYYTYTHMVDVMNYSILLGTRLGFKEGKELTDLGQSALLHDVGKAYVDPDILNKNGPLDDEEFNKVKLHPEFGYDALKSTGNLSDYILDGVRHHHEDLVGSGYTDGLKSDEIGINVRIITCADIFNALNTKRVYRPAIPAFSALKMMKEWLETKIDRNVFRGFVKVMGEF